MGIFYEQVEIINLAPIALGVTYDGQRTMVPPGKSLLPKAVLFHARNQNPVMGSQSAFNPSASGARYLISVKGSKKERQNPLTDEEWQAHLNAPSRINTEELYNDVLDAKERVEVRGRGRKTQARSGFEAGVRHTMSIDDTAKD